MYTDYVNICLKVSKKKAYAIIMVIYLIKVITKTNVMKTAFINMCPNDFEPGVLWFQLPDSVCAILL